MPINFDRLTEPTPQEVEVQRLVLASEDAVAGANPLDRVACAIIKVYRDYLDARIRNTTDEFESKNLKLYACSNDIRRARTDCLRLVGGMRSRASICDREGTVAAVSDPPRTIWSGFEAQD